MLKAVYANKKVATKLLACITKKTGVITMHLSAMVGTEVG